MGYISAPFVLQIGKAITGSVPAYNLVVGSTGELEQTPTTSSVDTSRAAAALSNWTAFTGKLEVGALDAGWSPGEQQFIVMGGYQGAGNYIAKSYDAVTWAQQAVAFGSSGVGTNRILLWNPDLQHWIAAVSGAVYISTDGGTTWTKNAFPAEYGGEVSGITWSPALQLYVVSFYSGGTATPTLINSPNGEAWSGPTSGSNENCNGVYWIEELGYFVAVYSSVAKLGISSNGSDWADVDLPGWHGYDLGWSPLLGKAIVTRGSPGVDAAVSTDGLTWTAVTIPNVGANTYPTQCTWCDSLQAMVLSAYQSIAYSFDMENWEQISGLTDVGQTVPTWSEEMGIMVLRSVTSTGGYYSQPIKGETFPKLYTGSAVVGGVPVAGNGTELSVTGAVAATNIVAGTLTDLGVPVSGTVYQNQNAFSILVYVPVTFAAASAVAFAVGSATPPGTIITDTLPTGATAGHVRTMPIWVPPSWYWSVTETGGATFGTAYSVAGSV